MSRYIYMIGSVLGLIVLLEIAGCSGTGIQRSYNDPTAEGQLVGRIAVLAFTPNPEVKVEFEMVFANYLRERGNDAVEAHTLRQSDLEPTRDALRELVKAEKLDGVFTVRVLPGDPNQTGEAKKTAYRPDRDGDLYEYFFRSRRSMENPDKAPVQGLIYLESRLYATKNAQVTWGGLTVSEVDDDLSVFTKHFAEAAVFEMAAKGYVK